MNSLNPLNWQSFKKVLLANTEKILQFEYANGQMVNASYHITEIKQAPIVSVDCGGVMNSWTEVILQLWEPPVMETKHAMTVDKAFSIISLVEKLLPLNPLGTVKIEFGNSKFETRQMYPGDFRIDEDSIIVMLVPDYTQCKAITRNQSCGTSSKDAMDVMPVNKPDNAIFEMEGNKNLSCAPGSGCC